MEAQRDTGAATGKRNTETGVIGYMCEPAAAAEFIGNDIREGDFDPGDHYTIEFIEMTQEELDALGEWGGW